MDEYQQAISRSIGSWDDYPNAQQLVFDLLPIIAAPEAIDKVLAHLPPRARPQMVWALRDGYGPHLDPDHFSELWAVSAGGFTDLEEKQRRHRAFVQHVSSVAVPAIRAWLAAHPDEPSEPVKRRPRSRAAP